ncbi:hypothetical protein AMS68_005100 [Peltaster fructicola]|uniref:MARVEL domain-containing protein n=1 Tax=Peltaster fructicola TaxID=286661 RepID=A0A6H0XXV2_9PEZI|nr:hypothetical protein AMS68_005100 [Peltaster fructicola]
MAIPEYGAAPLAKTFVLLRCLALVAMVSIVGMTANFVSEIVGSNIDPPKEVIGTLIVTCTAALYCLISIPFFWAQANLGLFIMAGLDTLLLLAFVIVSVLLGKPVSFLNCAVINNSSAAATSTNVYAFTQSLSTNLGVSGSTLDLTSWVGNTQLNCYETKAIWGLCIALCIIFSCTALLLPALWYKAKKASAPAKSVV